VGGGAAEGLVVDVLTDGGFHEVAAGEEDAAGLLHDEGFVAHDGQVGATGHAAAHDGGDLRDAHGAHHGVVAKDPAEVLLVGEDLVLHGQEYAGAVHEVDDGQAVLDGDLLCAEVLFARHGEPGAGLHGGIVGHHHALALAHVADHHHHAGRRCAAMLGVHAVGGEGTDLDARALGVQQRVDALAGGHFALLVQLGDALFTATFVDLVQALVEVGTGEFVVVLVLGGFDIDLLGHGAKIGGRFTTAALRQGECGMLNRKARCVLSSYVQGQNRSPKA
jgi:hypothetical protein